MDQAGLKPHVRSDEDGGIADQRWNRGVKPFDSPVAGATVSMRQSEFETPSKTTTAPPLRSRSQGLFRMILQKIDDRLAQLPVLWMLEYLAPVSRARKWQSQNVTDVRGRAVGH